WGYECLNRLNGMFAFAIWDSRDDSLFAARDRLGIKPFYYVHLPESLAFASEIKSLLELPGLQREVDLAALDQFMTFLWTPDPTTMFKGVFKLPPASYLVYREGQVRVSEYWDLKFDEEHSISEGEWTSRIRDQIAESVRAQMLADVPLGAFLSGGLDSSTVVALMSDSGAREITTYTFGFNKRDLSYDIQEDDVKYARIVGQQFNTDYQEHLLEPSVIEFLPKLVYHMDEPIADPAIITSYLICRAARERLTVLLSGMGGDEVFAGYPRHAAVRVADAYNLVPEFISKPLIGALPGARPGRFNALFRNAKKLARSAALPERERFLGFGTYFSAQEKLDLYGGELRLASEGFDPYREHRRFFDRVSDQDFVNQMLY